MSGGAIGGPVKAKLDGAGQVLSADAPLLALQREAGGAENGALAIPALADLVRLVLRLHIPISRAVTIAGDEVDISMWVQIRPDEDGLELTIVDWQTRLNRPVQLAMSANARPLPAMPAGGWAWQVDEVLCFGRVTASMVDIGHAPPEAGAALTSYFTLTEEVDADAHGAMPMLAALAGRAPFIGQRARLRSDPAIHYLLSGMPMQDLSGGLIGYRGYAVRTEDAARAPTPGASGQHSEGTTSDATGLFGSDFGRRLDQALRQPIGRIIANASTISGQLEGPLRQDYANYAADIAMAGRHLMELVDDLTDLQAIERPGFTTAREEVDLADLARRAAGLLNVKAAAKGIRIETPALGEHVPSCGEFRRVLQILVNLIGNAVRYSPADSVIWVRVDADGGRARVLVADQGGGIDPADHERIFERFERLGLGDTQGSGLGLYLSRLLARAMNGDVTLESALGKGARFMLDLPSWSTPKG